MGHCKSSPKGKVHSNTGIPKETKITMQRHILKNNADPCQIFFIMFNNPQASAHGTFSRIDHILGHKASLGKFKKIEIIPSIFSDHNAVRLDLN